MNELRNDNPMHGESGWEQCPAGEISGMVQQMKGRREKVFFLQLAGGAVFGMLLGLAFIASKGPQELRFGGIKCADVAKHTDAYLAGQIAPELKEQIDVHLAECPACGPRLRNMLEDRRVREASQRLTTEFDNGPERHLVSSVVEFRPVVALAR